MEPKEITIQTARMSHIRNRSPSNPISSPDEHTWHRNWNWIRTNKFSETAYEMGLKKRLCIGGRWRSNPSDGILEATQMHSTSSVCVCNDFNKFDIDFSQKTKVWRRTAWRKEWNKRFKFGKLFVLHGHARTHPLTWSVLSIPLVRRCSRNREHYRNGSENYPFVSASEWMNGN